MNPVPHTQTQVVFWSAHSGWHIWILVSIFGVLVGVFDVLIGVVVVLIGVLGVLVGVLGWRI